MTATREGQVGTAAKTDILRLEAGLAQLHHPGLLDTGQVMVALQDQVTQVQQGLVKLRRKRPLPGRQVAVA